MPMNPFRKASLAYVNEPWWLIDLADDTIVGGGPSEQYLLGYRAALAEFLSCDEDLWSVMEAKTYRKAHNLPEPRP